jgi:hypothetical protein
MNINQETGNRIKKETLPLIIIWSFKTKKYITKKIMSH